MPRYTDIDVNGHENNIKYADWPCNSFGIDAMKQSEIAFASFDFQHEVVPNLILENALIVDGDL